MPRAIGSIFVTVPLLALSTHTNPAPAAIAIGYGDSSPGRLTIEMRAVTLPVRGSSRKTVAALPLIAHTAFPAAASPSIAVPRFGARVTRAL